MHVIGVQPYEVGLLSTIVWLGDAGLYPVPLLLQISHDEPGVGVPVYPDGQTSAAHVPLDPGVQDGVGGGGGGGEPPPMLNV